MTNTILIQDYSEGDCVPELVVDRQTNCGADNCLLRKHRLVGWDLPSASYGQYQQQGKGQ